MSNDAFAQFEDEFLSITESLTRKITAMQKERDLEAIEQLSNEADGDVLDAKSCIGNIEREMRHWSYDQKSQAQGRLRTLRSDFEQLQQQLNDAKETRGGGAPAGLSRADKKRWKEQRKRLLGTNQMIDNTSISLDRTAQVLAETTSTGAATTITLQEQREQIIRARETVRETDGLLVKSRKTLRRMSRRVVTNKIIQGLIMLLEVAVIVLIVYFKDCSCGHPAAQTPTPAP